MKEARHKRLHTVYFYFYETLEKAKLLRQKADQWLLRLAEGLIAEGRREHFGGMKLFSILIVVLDTFVRTHQTIDLEEVNFTLYVKIKRQHCSLKSRARGIVNAI